MFTWEDITLYVDTVNNIIVGETWSLSPIVMGGPGAPGTGANTNALLTLALALIAMGGAVVYRRNSWLRFF